MKLWSSSMTLKQSIAVFNGKIEYIQGNVKAILICFSYSKCITNLFFQNSHTYWLLVFKSPWQNICQKMPELQSGKWPLHHDNTLSHTTFVNPLNPELNPICYLLALLAYHFLHVSRIMVKSLTLRLLMSYIYIWSAYS